MKYILRSWGNFFRFILGLVVIALLITRITNSIRETSFDLKFTTDQTLVTIKDKKWVITHSVLSACDCWVNTGVEVRPGEECELKVTGKTHGAIDYLVKDAENNNLPAFTWNGPEGREFKIRAEDKIAHLDSLRKKLLLDPNAKMGQVLFFIQKQEVHPTCELSGSEVSPNEIHAYDNKGWKFTNDSKETWYIWATVNDLLIKDFNDKTAYEVYLGLTEKESRIKREKSWPVLAKEKYNTLWYDDNIGSFIISAKIERPENRLNLWKFW